MNIMPLTICKYNSLKQRKMSGQTKSLFSGGEVCRAMCRLVLGLDDQNFLEFFPHHEYKTQYVCIYIYIYIYIYI